MPRSRSLPKHWTDDDEVTYERRVAEERERMALEIVELFEAAIPEQVVRIQMSDWAEAHRILPSNLTPLPGPFRWRVTPYMREIADCLSEDSPVRKVAVRKASQIAYNAALVENWIGYTIDVAPGSMMFVGSDAGMAETTVELRIDNMIETSGIAHKIAAQTAHLKRTGRRSGDTKSRKDFPGGFLMAIGPRSGGKLRSFPIRYLIFDEIEAYPQNIGGGAMGKTADEGDPIRLAEQRTVAFERTRKILYGSTPLIAAGSRIDPLFARGDQRYYYVPCKHCGHMQVLHWRIEREDGKPFYPLKYEVDEMGRLIRDSVHYECQACGGHWTNADKSRFLQRGEWRPTAEPMEEGFRSYQISALYSPVGMRSWQSICQEWIDCREGRDVTKLRAFVNLTLGESFEERGEAPEHSLIMARKEGYQSEQLLVDDNGLITEIVAAERPDRALFCTIGADIQADRIECEIVAWGVDAESWSLGYHVLPGDTSQASACWQNLRTLITSWHSGMPVMKALIDSGYNAPMVYRFCSEFTGALPSKGDDKVGSSKRIFQRGKIDSAPIELVRLETGHLKLELYSFLRIGTVDGRPPTELLRGYCHFPLDYAEAYYRQLTSEDRRREVDRRGRSKMIWHLPSGRRNEALDVRVYAMGALYVFAGDVCDFLELDQIEWGVFWGHAETQMAKTLDLSVAGG